MTIERFDRFRGGEGAVDELRCALRDDDKGRILHWAGVLVREAAAIAEEITHDFAFDYVEVEDAS